MDAFEIRHFGRVAGLAKRLVAGLDERRDAAAKHGLFAEKVGFALFLHRRFDDAGPARAEAAPAARLARQKQAISICTAAPSQRAAALVLGARSDSPPAEARAPRGAGKDDSRYSLMELAARLDGVGNDLD